MEEEELKAFLEERFLKYNAPDFIEADPISIPHQFSLKEDIEIAGLLSALIAWGRRDLIVRSARALVGRMGESPLDFLLAASDEHLLDFQDFVYRTFQGMDCYFILSGLRKVYAELGGLEQVMRLLPEDQDTRRAIAGLRDAISSVPDFPQRTFKHLANPQTGSSAKRLNMFLRWMVRKDKRGVDFGLWSSIRPDQLICPLDVHTGTVARKLGLLSRKQNDWKAALALTERLRVFDPVDPVKYDFALFGLGVHKDW